MLLKRYSLPSIVEEIPSTDHVATNPLDQENTLAQPVYEAYY